MARGRRHCGAQSRSGSPRGGLVSLLGPIFVREWLTVPRQPRHYVMRVAYLGLLWVLGLTAWQYTVGWEQTATLGDNARFGFLLFQVLTYYVQLPLLIFFSALSAASAVAREKDRRTFILLLMTDLRNYEIVLGKLLGSLLQIALLLGTMIPFLSLLVLLGGVAPEQVVQATVIMAATALAAGSLGSLIALWRDKTFPALALTALFLVLYLCLVQALGRLPSVLVWFAGDNYSAQWLASWEKWLDPFQAMRSVLETTVETESSFPAAYGFAAAMLVLTFLLNAWAVIRLRVWNPSG